MNTKFGPRIHPVTGKKGFHYGIDIAVKQGTPVYSIGKGTVFAANYSNTAGNLVVLIHPNGYMSEYIHLQKILVKVGDGVDKNTKIGLVGSVSYTHLTLPTTPYV